MVRAWKPIRLAAASAEMRHDATPAKDLQMLHERCRIMRSRIAFETMKQHDERRIGGRATGRIEPVEIDEITVGRVDALTTIRDVRTTTQQERINRLRVSADEPAWREVCPITMAHPSIDCSSRSTMVLSTLMRA